LEKVKLVIDAERFISVDNPFGEKSHDYISKGTYIFETGKIYGVVCEHGGGGESVSLLLSNNVSLINERVYIDDVEVQATEIEKYGWYVGKTLYSKGFVKKELSAKKALEHAIERHHRYERVEDIAEEFHLALDKLDYGLSKNCEWEKWRTSVAIGYASNKKIYCFPWMDTMTFYDCMYNSSVFRFFKKLMSEDAIIILPTSREENIRELANHIIKIRSPRFEHIISESNYFKDYF